YIWYGTSWAVKELNANYLGQCVNVGGSAVGRVIRIAPAISRVGPFMSLDENYRPVARGKVRVAIGDTVGLYDAAGSLTLTGCAVARYSGLNRRPIPHQHCAGPSANQKRNRKLP